MEVTNRDAAEVKSRLKQLFDSCDQNRNGFLDLEGIIDLCKGIGIQAEDAQIIFEDLDHDRDGRIDFDDFYDGFHHFLESSGADSEMDEANELYSRRKSLHNTWEIVSANLNDVECNYPIHLSSQEKLLEIYQDLQTQGHLSSLVRKYEDTLRSLFREIQGLHQENRKLESIYQKEKKDHEHNLLSLEEELGEQVAKVEAQAERKAVIQAGLKKKLLQEDLDNQMNELKDYAKLFEKVDSWLAKQEVEEKKTNSMKMNLEMFSDENYLLKRTLQDIQMKMALLRTEMSELKSQYNVKCKELATDRDLLVEYMEQQANMQRQMDFLHSPELRMSSFPDRSLSKSDIQRDESPPSASSSPGRADSSEKLEEPIPTHEDGSVIFSIREFPNSSKRIRPQHSEGHASSTCPPDNLTATGDPECTYRIVFGGDASVGKTSFIVNACGRGFDSNLRATLGVDFQIRTLRIDGKNVSLQLWDTAGQERFKSMSRSYFRRADGVILMYDVTCPSSFVNVRQWMLEVHDLTEKQVPIILCANKTDLRGAQQEREEEEGEQCVTTEQGRSLAEENGVIFMETSAKNGRNVQEAVVQLTRQMMLTEEIDIQTSLIRVRRQDKAAVSRKCCSSG